MMIDPNEAPEGYRAEPLQDRQFDPCKGCDIKNLPECFVVCCAYPCAYHKRADGYGVIFKRISRVMATVPLNYGSMGEEVGP